MGGSRDRHGGDARAAGRLGDLALRSTGAAAWRCSWRWSTGSGGMPFRRRRFAAALLPETPCGLVEAGEATGTWIGPGSSAKLIASLGLHRQLKLTMLYIKIVLWPRRSLWASSS